MFVTAKSWQAEARRVMTERLAAHRSALMRCIKVSPVGTAWAGRAALVGAVAGLPMGKGR